MKEIRTKIGQLHLYDLVKAAFISAIIGPMELMLETLDKGQIPTDINWLAMGKIVVSAFFAYIIKQLLTGKSGKILNNKTMNYAHQVNNYTDIEQSSMDSATVYAGNNGLSVIDGEDGLPNICQIGGSQPSPLQFRDAITNQLYMTTVVGYLGTRPPGR